MIPVAVYFIDTLSHQQIKGRLPAFMGVLVNLGTNFGSIIETADMKRTHIVSYLILAVALLAGPLLSRAQSDNTTTEQAVKNMVEKQDFVFLPDRVMPMSGNSRYLQPGYEVKIGHDLIVSDLPYFGKAYTAPINPAEGGIKFSSRDFKYVKTERRKGGWDISIKPKDTGDIDQMTLTISKNGTASLQVTPTNKQPINFSGNISAPRSK